jgi:hypothetical protein
VLWFSVVAQEQNQAYDVDQQVPIASGVNEAAVLVDREAEEETKVHGSAIAERMAENENVNMDALVRPRRML